MPTFMKTAGWFQSMKLEPALLLNNIFQSNEDIPKIQQRFRSLKRSGTFVLNLFSGFWNTKVSRIFLMAQLVDERYFCHNI